MRIVQFKMSIKAGKVESACWRMQIRMKNAENLSQPCQLPGLSVDASDEVDIPVERGAQVGTVLNSRNRSFLCIPIELTLKVRKTRCLNA